MKNINNFTLSTYLGLSFLFSLLLVCKHGHWKILKNLMSRQITTLNSPNDLNETPLHLAVKNGYQQCVEMLVGGSSSSSNSGGGAGDASSGIDTPSGEGKTPLHYASEKGHQG